MRLLFCLFNGFCLSNDIRLWFCTKRADSQRYKSCWNDVNRKQIFSFSPLPMMNGKIISQEANTDTPSSQIKERLFFVPILTYCKVGCFFCQCVTRFLCDGVRPGRQTRWQRQQQTSGYFWYLLYYDNFRQHIYFFGDIKDVHDCSPRWTTQIILHFIKQQFCYSFRGLGGKKRQIRT